MRALRNEVRCELDTHELIYKYDGHDSKSVAEGQFQIRMLWIGMDETYNAAHTHTETHTHRYIYIYIYAHGHRGLHRENVRFAISGLKLKLGSSST